MGAPSTSPCSKPPVYPYKNVLKYGGSKQPTPLLQWPEPQAHKQQRPDAGTQGTSAQQKRLRSPSAASRTHTGQQLRKGVPRDQQHGGDEDASHHAGCDTSAREGLDQAASRRSSGSSCSSNSNSRDAACVRPAAASTSFTRGKGLLNRSFERVCQALSTSGAGSSEIRPELELRLLNGQQQPAPSAQAACITEAVLEKQWQDSWVGVPRRRRSRHCKAGVTTEVAPGCTEEHNPLLLHMQQSSQPPGAVVLNPLPAAMGSMSSGPWVVVAGVVLGAALSGGAVAVAFGLASWITKTALVYGFAWKTATGAAAVEGLCFGGVSSAKLQAAHAQAANMQHQLVQMYAEASRQANGYAEQVQSATLRHEQQVAEFMQLNERLSLTVDSLRAEQRTAEATVHKEALLKEREHNGSVHADMHAMAAHQARVLGALEALKNEIAGIKGQATGWVGSDAVLATQQASTWPSGQALFA